MHSRHRDIFVWPGSDASIKVLTAIGCPYLPSYVAITRVSTAQETHRLTDCASWLSPLDAARAHTMTTMHVASLSLLQFSLPSSTLPAFSVVSVQVFEKRSDDVKLKENVYEVIMHRNIRRTLRDVKQSARALHQRSTPGCALACAQDASCWLYADDDCIMTKCGVCPPRLHSGSVIEHSIPLLL